MKRSMDISIAVAILGQGCALVYGYFATLRGFRAAYHGWPVVFAVLTMVFGAIYANLAIEKRRALQTEVDDGEIQSGDLSQALEKLGTRLSLMAGFVFIVETNLSQLSWRIYFGLASLALFLISIALPLFGKYISSRTARKN